MVSLPRPPSSTLSNSLPVSALFRPLPVALMLPASASSTTFSTFTPSLSRLKLTLLRTVSTPPGAPASVSWTRSPEPTM